MADVSMKALLETGVHFGHRTHKREPKMKPYIFTERNGIHILDLQQTTSSIRASFKIVRDVVAAGGVVLFVGTKRQAQDAVQTEAERCGMPYVSNRWLGGLMTNWRTIKDRIRDLERMERAQAANEWDKLKKKERLILERKLSKLVDRLGGIRNMLKTPQMLFIVDVRREETAVKESNKLEIPVMAMVDTNCDPSNIDHVIPANDDAIRAIKLVLAHMADAVLEGIGMRKDDPNAESVAESTDEVIDEDTLDWVSQGVKDKVRIGIGADDGDPLPGAAADAEQAAQ
ncbi:MAG: 30S ribosomal protein S2 [Chloroflexi bacterium]|nr:30S ribosomal protein S2 [Chloroflexota bacterium]RLT46093.1 MAG: 30S ribosomal protein S2 [Chloroflexota bacterium]RLT46108.1 MAG: 30S ribosomal protein S2 [Chloroflexota bacterium]RLT52994.1 MAG: 30S ribosomal protein S2 [Chloroflexota bacterium]